MRLTTEQVQILAKNGFTCIHREALFRNATEYERRKNKGVVTVFRLNPFIYRHFRDKNTWEDVLEWLVTIKMENKDGT